MDTQQFEVIRPKCAGLDVHKKSVVAAVCTSDPVTLTASYKTKVFNTNNFRYRRPARLASRTGLPRCLHGIHWQIFGSPFFNILEPHMHVVLTHPKYVKAIKGKRRTGVDAKCIANLYPL